jgi:streptomycin 6-kinase
MAWLARLPDVVADLQRRWSLSLGAPFVDEGSCALVAPATLADGTSAVLKIGMPHMEAEDEIAGLRLWNGRATVRLLEADETLHAMLLEACVPGTPLRSLAEPQQDEVLGHLLQEIWRTPPPPPGAFRPLSAMLDYWSTETLAAEDRWTDRALVQAGLDLFRELPRMAEREVLLFTDLHAGNVLRAHRSPWLAIDPKPFFGDPAYDATQHLRNCLDRMQVDPRGTIAAFAHQLDMSPERIRLWMFARAAAEPRKRWAGDAWFGIARTIAP